MSSIEFEIAIQRKFGQSWPVVVRVKQPDGLTTHTEGTLQLSEQDLIQLKQEQENYLAYGTILGKALFRENIRETFVRTLGQSLEGVSMRVLLSNEADSQDELRSLHWERLCAPIDAGGEWNLLARDQRIPYSQYIPTIIDRRFPPMGRRDLRALIVVASPTNLGKYNLAEFNVEQAVNSVREALGEIPSDVLANLEGALGEPTLEQLSARLTEAPKPYTLLHFVCHGMVGKDGETALFWASKDNQVQLVKGVDLLKELKYIGNQQGLPQLSFLCSCETADPRAEAALGGLAQRLVRDLGMPAVVAMTRKVSVETALQLGQKFYRRLREHGEVDLALDEATAGLGHRQDITVPVLFSRLGGRPLFSDRLEGRELTDGEIEFGLEELGKLIAERAPNAKVLKESFEQQVQILKQTQGSQLPAARQQRQQALDELNLLCSQVLEISFEALAALDKKPPEYHAECPFPGLSSFRKQKYHKFFFGRELLVAELQQALLKDNFLAVLGPSGSGKSSVVLAGLIPQLQKQQPALQKAYLTPSSEPVAELQASLSKVPNQHLVLVVDQFEELFTLCSDEGQRREFIEQLLQLAQTQKVVITVRADFLGECTFYEQLRQRIEHNSKLVGPMDAAQLGKAMKMQADEAYLEFEEGLNNAILAEVEQEPGAMPLLQYALRSLWNRRRGRWLCYEEYEAIGGVQKAISQTADTVYESLSAVEQEQIKNIFIRLTRLDKQTVGVEQRRDTRRRVGLEELVPSGDDSTVTKQLVQRLAGEGARLVVTSRNEVTGFEEVEVAHEALISHWERLQKWLEENRSNLQLRENITEAAREWSGHQKEESYLVHRGGRLEDAEVLLKQPQFLNRMETNYVTACVALRDRLEQEKEAQRRRNLRTAWGIAVGSLVAVVVSTFLGLMAWHQQKLAVVQHKKAELNLAKSLAHSSLSLFAEGKELDALVEAIHAGKILQKQKVSNLEVMRALEKALYEGRERNRLQGHNSWIFSVSFSPDGQILASSSGDKTIKLWNSETGAEILTLTGHDDVVHSVSFSPDGRTLASGSWDQTIKLWNAETGTEIRTLTGHKDWIVGVSFSPDGGTLASGSWDKTIKLWNLETGTEIRTLTGHDDRVRSISFSPDGQTLASGSWDKTIKLWDLETGREIRTLTGHDDVVHSVSFSPDGRTLASGSWDKTIKLWDLEMGTEIRTLTGHDDDVQSVSFSPDGQVLVSGSDDKTIKFWDLEMGTEIRTLTGHNKPVWSVSFSPDGQTLASGSWDETIKLWDLEMGREIRTFTGHGEDVQSVSFSPDGQALASGGWDETIKLWDLETGREILILTGHGDDVQSVSFSPDGQILASGSSDQNIKLWDLETGREIRTLTGHNGWIVSLSFSPDGQVLASGSSDKTIKLWDFQTGAAIRTLTGHNGWIFSVSFSPDGQVLASGSDDKTIKLWNLQTGAAIRTLTGHDDRVRSVSFSPDGQVLASGSDDKTIKLWNLQTGAAIHTLTGHSDDVHSVSFSPDGQALASGSWDKTIKLWNLNTAWDLDSLMERSCDWVRNYLQYNPNVSESDKHLCEGIGTSK